MKLTTGSIAPDFSYQTAHGSGVLSETLRKSEKTLLIFSRYLGCPFCQLDLLTLAEDYKLFQKKNTQILLVLQSSAETLRQQTLLNEPPFTIISDPEQQIYSLYDVSPAPSMMKMIRLNRKLLKKALALVKRGLKHGAYEGNEQQLPAFFILDREKTILHTHYASSISDMPDVEELLNLL